MFRLMLLQSKLCSKPFRAQITWECAAFMFSEVRCVVTFHSKSSLTWLAPEAPLPSMLLHVHVKTRWCLECFATSVTTKITSIWDFNFCCGGFASGACGNNRTAWDANGTDMSPSQNWSRVPGSDCRVLWLERAWECLLLLRYSSGHPSTLSWCSNNRTRCSGNEEFLLNDSRPLQK